MSEIVVKYQVRDEEGRVLPEHSTYSHSFESVKIAEKWIEEEGDLFVQACLIDSENIGGGFSADDLLIVRVNGFPIVEEEVLLYV